MVELIGVHTPHEEDVIGFRTNMWQQIGKLCAAFTVLLERAVGAHQLCGVFLDERKADVLGHRLGQFLPVHFVEFRLVVSFRFGLASFRFFLFSLLLLLIFGKSD